MITCGGPCYFYEPAISTFDQFMKFVSPVTISTFANFALLFRVVRQKRHMQQQQMWKKSTFSYTIMFFSTVPQSVLVNLSIDILPNRIYVVILLCPFVSLMSLPEIWPKFNLRILPSIVTRNTLQYTTQLQIIRIDIHIRGVAVDPKRIH